MVPNQQLCPRPITGTSFTELSPIRRGFFFNLARHHSEFFVPPTGAFTSRLPTDRLPSPLLDMTTTATGLLCWRDSHPLEWQLASLHQIRTCGFPAYGSHLG